MAGKAIIVNLGHNGTAVTTTAADLKAAILANPAASALVTVTSKGSETGVGLQQGFGCWLDHFGYPSFVSFREQTEGYLISSAGWEQVTAYDWYGGGKDGFDADGLIESISLFAPGDPEN